MCISAIVLVSYCLKLRLASKAGLLCVDSFLKMALLLGLVF